MIPRTPRQAKLISTDGADLPGPHFAPRPGWGGQLKAWLSTHIRMMLFRGALVLAAALIVTSFWRTVPTQEPAEDHEQTPAISETAARGEGTSHLAARALDRALIDRTQTLDPVERTWAIQLLVEPWTGLRLEPGMQMDFPLHDIADAIDRAKALSPTQRQALKRYLR